MISSLAQIRCNSTDDFDRQTGPIANIVFKCYTYMSLVQAIDLTSDLKLGLYAKIPPKQMFIAQVYGTTLGAFVNYTLIRGIIEAKRDYLDGSVVDPTGESFVF